MNRYILTIIMILSSMYVMSNKANACVNEVPIPGISNGTQYEDVGQNVYFEGYDYSYDPDDGEPYGYGNGITEWYWEIWDEYDNYVDEMSGENPGYAFNTPGIYYVYLWVKRLSNIFSVNSFFV